MEQVSGTFRISFKVLKHIKALFFTAAYSALTQAWPLCSLTSLKQDIYSFCSNICCFTYSFFFSRRFYLFRLCCDCPTFVAFTCSLLISACYVFKPLVFLSSLFHCNITEACFSSSLEIRRLSVSLSCQTLSDCDPMLCFYALIDTVKLNLFSGWHFYLGPSLSRVCFSFSLPGLGWCLRGKHILTVKILPLSNAQKMPLPSVSVTHSPFSLLFASLVHTINAGIPNVKC